MDPAAGRLSYGYHAICGVVAPGGPVFHVWRVSARGAARRSCGPQLGALIAIIGGMLIYGSFNPPVRALVMVVAVLSKLIFSILAVVNGFGSQLAVAISFDVIVIAVFVSYLVTRKPPLSGL